MWLFLSSSFPAQCLTVTALRQELCLSAATCNFALWAIPSMLLTTSAPQHAAYPFDLPEFRVNATLKRHAWESLGSQKTHEA